MGIPPYTTTPVVPVIRTGIVPHTGGDQALATTLTAGWMFLASGENASSVQLPDATAGALVVIVPPDGVTYLLYAKNGTPDQINGQSNPTAFDLATYPAVTVLGCETAGAWRGNISPD